MNKPIRLAEVAKAAGVSHGTASNVFSKPEVVRPEVRERVLAAAAKLNYAGPDPRGRMLRAGKVNTIGVATAEPLSYFFDDPFARVVMAGISAACDARGAGISLVSAANDEQLAWNMQSALVDGFVVFCIEGGSRLVELARERRLPFVTLDYGFDEPDISTIGIDDGAGAQMAARHLLELGHRRFGVLAMEFDDDGARQVEASQRAKAIYSGTADRLQGYFEAIAEAGIDTDRIPIYATDTPRRETTRAGLEYIFGGDDQPTAILAMSDLIALNALDWLRERGLRVPEDVSIIGFDGVPETERSNPPLTTISQPAFEMGRKAAEMILTGGFDLQRETLPVQLVVRQSTGIAPA